MEDGELSALIAGCKTGDRTCQRRLFHAYRERVARIVGGFLFRARADLERLLRADGLTAGAGVTPALPLAGCALAACALLVAGIGAPIFADSAMRASAHAEASNP